MEEENPQNTINMSSILLTNERKSLNFTSELDSIEVQAAKKHLLTLSKISKSVSPSWDENIEEKEIRYSKVTYGSWDDGGTTPDYIKFDEGEDECEDEDEDESKNQHVSSLNGLSNSEEECSLLSYEPSPNKNSAFYSKYQSPSSPTQYLGSNIYSTMKINKTPINGEGKKLSESFPSLEVMEELTADAFDLQTFELVTYEKQKENSQVPDLKHIQNEDFIARNDISYNFNPLKPSGSIRFAPNESSINSGGMCNQTDEIGIDGTFNIDMVNQKSPKTKQAIDRYQSIGSDGTLCFDSQGNSMNDTAIDHKLIRHQNQIIKGLNKEIEILKGNNIKIINRI